MFSARLVELQKGEAFQICAIQQGRDCEVEKFLCEQASKLPKESAKLVALIDRTADHGIPKNKTKVNTLGDGLFEFKTSGGLRLIWFYDAGRLILCTHGFVKKSQNTPKKELKRAQSMKLQYEKAKASGNIQS